MGLCAFVVVGPVGGRNYDWNGWKRKKRVMCCGCNQLSLGAVDPLNA